MASNARQFSTDVKTHDKIAAGLFLGLLHPATPQDAKMPATYGVPETRDPAQEVSLARTDSKQHLLLAASGSVATIKIVPIIRALESYKNLSIRLVLTTSAARFLDGQSQEQPTLKEISAMDNVDGLYMDDAEWSPPWKRGAPILHIELRKCKSLAHRLVDTSLNQQGPMFSLSPLSAPIPWPRWWLG